MIVALVLAVALVVQTLAFTGLLLKQERRHSRRIDTLLDRLAHAQGRTWTPPPAEDGESEPLAIADYDPFHQPD